MALFKLFKNKKQRQKFVEEVAEIKSNDTIVTTKDGKHKKLVVDSMCKRK